MNIFVIAEQRSSDKLKERNKTRKVIRRIKKLKPKGKNKMTTQRSSIAVLALTLFVMSLIVLTTVLSGCGETGNLVSNSPSLGMTDNRDHPNNPYVTLKVDLNLGPFGEKIISAAELRLSYISSVTLVPADNPTSDKSEFCNSIEIRSDDPADVEYSGCTTGDIRAKNVFVKNTEKSKLHMTAIIKGRSSSVIPTTGE